MPEVAVFKPAVKQAATNQAHYPNETPEYRAARNALVTEEIEQRRHIERVAAMRRGLPPGGQISEDFAFEGESGPTRLSILFGGKDTLLVYSMMFGPQRNEPCPMCTSFISAWNGIGVNLRERGAMAVTSRSPIERLVQIQAGAWFRGRAVLLRRQRQLHPHLRRAEEADIPSLIGAVRC